MTASKHAQAQELARRLREWPVGGRKNTPAADCHEAAAMIDALLREWPEAGDRAVAEHCAKIAADITRKNSSTEGAKFIGGKIEDRILGYASALPRAPGFSDEEIRAGVRILKSLINTRVPPFELPADSFLEKAVRAILRESGK